MSTDGGAFLPLACGAAPCTAADFVGGTTPDDFLDNIAQPDTLTDYWTVDRAALESIFRAQPAANRTRYVVPGSTFQVNEKTYGGYAMAKLGGQGWSANVGVPVVRPEQKLGRASVRERV